MDDFEPENVAKQVKPLKELMDLRTKLSDLRGSLQGNDKLEELLLDAVGDKDKLDKLKKEMDRREVPMAEAKKTEAAAPKQSNKFSKKACSTRSLKKAAWPRTRAPRSVARTW